MFIYRYCFFFSRDDGESDVDEMDTVDDMMMLKNMKQHLPARPLDYL